MTYELEQLRERLTEDVAAARGEAPASVAFALSAIELAAANLGRTESIPTVADLMRFLKLVNEVTDSVNKAGDSAPAAARRQARGAAQAAPQGPRRLRRDRAQ